MRRVLVAGTQDVIEAARAELLEIEKTDEFERAEAAKRAHAQLDADALLFGVQMRTLTSRATGASVCRGSTAVTSRKSGAGTRFAMCAANSAT